MEAATTSTHYTLDMALSALRKAETAEADGAAERPVTVTEPKIPEPRQPGARRLSKAERRAAKAARKAARKLARKKKQRTSSRRGRGGLSRKKTKHKLLASVSEEGGGEDGEEGGGEGSGRRRSRRKKQRGTRKPKGGLARKPSKARMSRLHARRGSLDRLQLMADAERARRALMDATKVALDVKHAGNTAAAKAHGKAKLRWMSAARSVIDANREKKKKKKKKTTKQQQHQQYLYY